MANSRDLIVSALASLQDALGEMRQARPMVRREVAEGNRREMDVPFFDHLIDKLEQVESDLQSLAG